MLEKLRKFRMKMWNMWNKFAREFLLKYSLRGDKDRILKIKDFHHKIRLPVKVSEEYKES